MFSPHRPCHALLAASLLTATLLMHLFTPRVSAASGGCRSDPLVVLSNGVVLDLSVAIDSNVTDVKAIAYTLHGPAGVEVVRAVSTDGPVQYKERFAFHGDRHRDGDVTGSTASYTLDVKVRTASGQHTIWATIAGGTPIR